MTPTAPERESDTFPIDDVQRLWCSIIVLRGHTEQPCSRKPTMREWAEVLIRGNESDLVIYPVCLFHYNRHLADGVISSLGKLRV